MPPLICKLDDVDKTDITEEKLEKSNLNGFNNNVGAVTNRATNIRNKMCLFDEDSLEYAELFDREMAIQRIQQSVIDSIKTGKSEKIPKSWYSYFPNKIITQQMLEDDKKAEIQATQEGNEEFKRTVFEEDVDGGCVLEQKEFNLRILADKKPYFMIYVYDHLKRRYNKYIEGINMNSIRRYGMNFNELLELHRNDKTTEDQIAFIDWVEIKMPVDMSPSVMNKICNVFENEFDDYNLKIRESGTFDYSIMMSDEEYDKSTFNKIKNLHKEFQNAIKEYVINCNNVNKDDEEIANEKNVFFEDFRERAMAICTNEKVLCNIVLDICYQSETNKQFAWDMCGKQIVKNLLDINENQITYIEKDEFGDIEFLGESFTEKKKKVEVS